MDFLKKAQQQANKTGAPVANKPKPAIPGIKPAVPGAKPAVPGVKPTVPGVKPPMPGTKPVAPGVKPTIPSRPAPTKPKVEETVETKGPIAAKSNPFKLNKTKAEPKIEEAVEVKEEVIPEVTEELAPAVVEKKEEAPVVTEDITEAAAVNEPISEKEVEEVKEAKETAKAAKKKATAKTKAKKATVKKEETVVDTPDEDTEVAPVVIPTTDMSYAEAVMSIKSSFVDEEWDAFKADTIERLEEIHISNDMTPSALKMTISDLNALRDSVWQHYLETKTFFETLTAKDDGLIDRVKRLNAKGSNENERKINSILALMNYKDANGKNINLYEILDASRARYNYTKELMEAIKYKSNAVITMLGNLKLEK